MKTFLWIVGIAAFLLACDAVGVMNTIYSTAVLAWMVGTTCKPEVR